MPEDFYDLLEVPTDADTRQIDRAFREKARVYHPDHNEHEQATEQFQVLKKAHEVLSDPQERTTYDQVGHGRYITKHLGGLPGIDVVTESPEPEPTPQSRNERAARQQAVTPDRTNGGTQPSATAGSSRRRRRRMYRTAPARPPAPARAMNAVFGVGIVLYAIGLWTFLQTERDIITHFLTVAGEEGWWSVLMTEHLPLNQALTFVGNGVQGGHVGPSLAFGFGMLLIGVAVVLAGYRIRTHVAWITGIAGSVPLAGLVVAWLNAAGLIDLQGALIQAIGPTLVVYVGAPIIVVAGWLVLLHQGRPL